MVIVNSYVEMPEGTNKLASLPQQLLVSSWRNRQLLWLAQDPKYHNYKSRDGSKSMNYSAEMCIPVVCQVVMLRSPLTTGHSRGLEKAIQKIETKTNSQMHITKLPENQLEQLKSLGPRSHASNSLNQRLEARSGSCVMSCPAKHQDVMVKCQGKDSRSTDALILGEQSRS